MNFTEITGRLSYSKNSDILPEPILTTKNGAAKQL